ncbi:MBL fold metallo-hydrolase [Desulfovibrio inopinatus]|uniref:MBL fold metallo-hydrolase n=1 Tax=Desulfovibrio inopinatus TaxID=102109 RepID=UPI00146F9F0F|nr:MBL fold metallo-hydrolase [Desulfovibrio inopinatus]
MFVGVGEAFDECLPNTSLLISGQTSAGQRLALVDCGFTAAASLFRFAGDAISHDLDLVFLSHFHGDHFLGLPFLLVRMWEAGRIRPLTIVGSTDIKEKTLAACELAYPGIVDRFAFAMQFVMCEPGNPQEVCDMRLETARTGHRAPCLALRIEDDTASLFYSGDGNPTQETEKLAHAVDVVVHEAYGMSPGTPGHCSLSESIDFARSVCAKSLALVHIGRENRRHHMTEIVHCLASVSDFWGCVPCPGECLTIPFAPCNLQ